MAFSSVLVLRHVPHEHLGALSAIFRKNRLPIRYLDMWKKWLSFPALPRVRGLVIMGGPMGVYEEDKYPFLKKEIAFIKKYIRTGRPALGICLGSQLLAKALGGRVFPSKRKEIGWYKVSLTPAGKRDAFFKTAPSSPWVFQWHGDTFTLPRGARHLARSPLCRHQAFRFGDNVYALQFHPEVDRAMVLEWMGQPGSRLELAAVGPRAFAQARAGVKNRLPSMQKWGLPFFERMIGSWR